MMEGESSSKKMAVPNDFGFTSILLSWSLEDIFNENLFQVFIKIICFCSYFFMGQNKND